MGLDESVELIPTSLTPEDIIGSPGNMKRFVAFLKIYDPRKNTEFPRKRLEKEFGKETLRKILLVLEELKLNGFHPGYVDSKGKVRWMVLKKSKSQELFERGLPELQKKKIDELQKLGRSGYKEVVDGVAVPRASAADIDSERVAHAGKPVNVPRRFRDPGSVDG